MPGLTIDAQNGRIIFTVKEPFGELLFSKLKTSNPLEDYNNASFDNLNQKKSIIVNTKYKFP